MEHFCACCDARVQAEYEEPEMRRLCKVYFAVGLIYLPFLPIIGADILLMIPNLVLHFFGAGAAMRDSTQPPICTACVAETEALAA